MMKRLLLCEGRAVQVTSKAFDTLILLIENPGRLLEKAEMIKALWPSTFVEGINLTVHISALRKALGERPNEHLYIVTVPGRGYRFVAPVKEAAPAGEDEQQRLTEVYTENAEACHLYIKGRYFWEKRRKTDLGRAVECFKQAIALDPRYALAYAGLGDSYALLGEYLYLHPGLAFPRAKAAVLTALEMDGSLAEARATLAEIRWFYDWNLREADAEYRRAIELRPTYATARHYRAWFLMMNGRLDEALAEIDLALHLDPYSLTIYLARGVLFYQAGHYEKAVALYREALDMDPGFTHTHYYMGQALAECGHLEEAAREFESIRHAEPVPQTLAMLGYTRGLSGDRQGALDILSELRELSKLRYISPLSFATIYAGMGEREKEFEFLEKAYEERSAWLAFLQGSPVFMRARHAPRFQYLLRRMSVHSLAP
jgi:serine/threonine-protein kinase